MNRITLSLLLLATPLLHAADWKPVPESSTLAFHGTQQGEGFDGRFKKFDAKVKFDPADVAATTISAEIDVTSADTANSERDGTLAGDEFFAFDKFPKASFRTTSCSGSAAEVKCEAELTIRDKTRPVAFPFQWQANGTGATLTARVALNRLDFDVGTGDWADDSTVGRQVEVDVKLSLVPAQ